MTFQVFIPLKNPPTTTHQQKQVTIKNGKPIFYEPDSLKEARSVLMAHLAKHTPIVPYNGPIHLLVKWCFPITKGHHDGEYKTTKPDVDNMMKLLLDCGTDLNYWTDDKIIASLTVQKFYSEITGIFISITNLEGENS